VCKESCAPPDGSRCEQLDVSHGGVERGLVARVGDSVEDLLQRRCDADVSGDVSHADMLSAGSGLTRPLLQSRHNHFAISANVRFCDRCAFLSVDRSVTGDQWQPRPRDRCSPQADRFALLLYVSRASPASLA
jgi:hypothetical protein